MVKASCSGSQGFRVQADVFGSVLLLYAISHQLRISRTLGARLAGGNVVVQLEVELVDQHVCGLVSQTRSNFVDDEVDRHTGTGPELIDGRLDSVPGLFCRHRIFLSA